MALSTIWLQLQLQKFTDAIATSYTLVVIVVEKVRKTFSFSFANINWIIDKWGIS